jgi:hypothetical protein
MRPATLTVMWVIEDASLCSNWHAGNFGDHYLVAHQNLNSISAIFENEALLIIRPGKEQPRRIGGCISRPVEAVERFPFAAIKVWVPQIKSDAIDPRHLGALAGVKH